MHHRSLWLFACAVAAGSALPGGTGRATTFDHYRVVPLVADRSGVAPHTDPLLINPWGLAFDRRDRGPFWVANNGTNSTTVYGGLGDAAGVTVSVPGQPTGVVANPGGAFGGHRFLFATLKGTVAGWRDGDTADVLADNSDQDAVYTGLAIGWRAGKPFLLAADFHNRRIDVFDSQLKAVKTGRAWKDPKLPEGYSPFGIHNADGIVYILYARLDEDGEDEETGPGKGIISRFDPSGRFRGRFATGTAAGGRVAGLNAPWGLCVAPSGFGRYAGKLLVGNFGSGEILVIDPNTGRFVARLQDRDGRPLRIRGLWELLPGGGGMAGNPHRVYFTAGPGDEQHGLFGRLDPVL